MSFKAPSVDSKAQDATAMQDLAERLLLHPYPGSPSRVQLFLRRLPPQIESVIPPPPGSRLLGSALHSRAAGPASMDAVFEASIGAQELVNRYEKELLAHGWSVFPGFGPPGGGFVPGEAGVGQAFRRGDQGPMLMVAAIARESVPSELRLKLDWDIIRHLPQMQRHGRPPGEEKMPALHAPPGIELRGAGGGGGDGNWHSEATVLTSHPPSELETHFARQLEAAGWKKVAGGADGVVGWSSWSLPGEGGWRGLLLVLSAFRDDERLLSLRIQAAEDGGGGWHSSSAPLISG